MMQRCLGGVNIRSREIITAAAEVISYLLVWSVQYFAKSPPCWLFTPSSDNVKRVNLKQKRCRKKLIGSTYMYPKQKGTSLFSECIGGGSRQSICGDLHEYHSTYIIKN